MKQAKKGSPAKRSPKAASKARAAAKRAVPKKTRAAAKQRPSAKTVRMAPRADFGAPVDGFFEKQPPELRPILVALKKLVLAAAPSTTASLKWGMPFYALDGNMVCALASFKSHVNLILPGPPGTYADPEGLLEGGGSSGKHLKLRSLSDLPTSTVRTWLKTAVGLAKRGETMGSKR